MAGTAVHFGGGGGRRISALDKALVVKDAPLPADHLVLAHWRTNAGLPPGDAAALAAGPAGTTLGASSWRVVVGGDSAGGNLAAVAGLMARNRGGPPTLAYAEKLTAAGIFARALVYDGLLHGFLPRGPAATAGGIPT